MISSSRCLCNIECKLFSNQDYIIEKRKGLNNHNYMYDNHKDPCGAFLKTSRLQSNS